MHKIIHKTSTNVFGRIRARIMPTATQNRANPTIRFRAHHLFTALFCYSMHLHTKIALFFLIQDIHYFFFCHFPVFPAENLSTTSGTISRIFVIVS